MSSFDEINKYIDDGNYRKAIEELDDIISKDPNNARAFYMRGKSAFIELQNEDNSQYDARKALIYSTIEYDLIKSINIDPNMIDAYRGLMYLNRDLKNIDKEREYAQILFEKDNMAYDALLILASSYLNNGENEADFHQALGYYDDFINNTNINESRIARFERGLCYYNLNILPKADIEANKLIQDFPFYDDAYFLKGIILSKSGVDSEFYEDALFFFDRAFELNNLNFNAVYERAEWYFSKDEYREAIKDYDFLMQHNNKYKLDAMLGKAQALHDLIIQNEDNENYTDSQEEGKDLKDAFSLLDKIINVFNVKSMQYRYYRSNLYSYQGEIKKAINELKKIVNEVNNVSWVYEKIAELYHNYAQSEEDYKEALKYLSYIDKNELTYSAYYILILSNYELERYEDTAVICKEFFQCDYDLEDYYIRFIYAHSLRMIGSDNYELILENLNLCLNSNLDKSLIYRYIAEIMIYIRHIDEGMYILKKAMELNDPIAYLIYAKELFYGDALTPCPEMAIGIANTAFEMDNKLEYALTIIGRGYELGRGIEKDHNKAFEMYYKADKLSSINNFKHSSSNGLLAHCYYIGIGVEKNEKLAFDIIQKAIKENGKNIHDNTALLYAYFALLNIEGFDLVKALSLFKNIEYNNLFIIMTLKRIYKKLNMNNEVKRISKIEVNSLKNSGELTLNYLRSYIKNFNNFYPILH